MPLGQLHVDASLYPPIASTCLRCGRDASLRFAGPCEQCVGELRAKYAGEARAVESADYEPAMNVTPNAVALKDD